jgi:hypothetical protein
MLKRQKERGDLSVCLIKHHSMKTNVGMEAQLHVFTNSGLDEGE